MTFRRTTALLAAAVASALVVIGVGSQAHASAGDKKVEVIKAVATSAE